MVLLAVAGMVYTLIAGNKPFLGLDLQGGVSVVLEPNTDADAETLEQTRDIIKQRVDGLGVAEPDVKVQGSNIVVALPGVEDQQRVLALVGETAELRFRAVYFNFGGGTVDETTVDLPEPMPEDPNATVPETVTTDAPAESTETTVATSEEEQGLADGIRGRRQTTTTTAADTSSTDDTSTTTTGDATTTDETVDPDSAVSTSDVAELTAEEVAVTEACFGDERLPTEPDADDGTGFALVTDDDGNLYCVGPTLFTGTALETASFSNPSGLEWQVDPIFKDGEAGIGQFNAAAALCFGGSPTCPSGQLAMVLDHNVLSAPTIQAASFVRDRIQITGSFTQESAEEVALKLRYGALPVELTAQDTRTVSATIGDDVLRSGLIAGIVGLSVVALFLLAYYRLAGLVALVGLIMSGMFLWTVIAWLGETQGLAITLAGIVGLIVSIGVSADSNIVYFENVKEAVRSGRRIPTSIDRAYQTSISTIIKADVVSLIAAALLYWLTVGAVRGFATYLGIATLLDLIIATIFMRPALAWIAGFEAVKKNPRLLGIRSIDADAGATS